MTQAQPQTEYSTSPSQVEIVRIRPGMVGPWAKEQMVKHLEPAMERSHGRIKIEQVFMLLATDQAQVWFTMDEEECISVVVTEVVQWVSGRLTLKVMLAGGFDGMYRTMEPMMERLEEYANLKICSSIIVEGRKGWGRTLPDGYEFSHCAFEKELL